MEAEEQKKSATTKSTSAAAWQKEIKAELKRREKWRKNSADILAEYAMQSEAFTADEDDDGLHILWSNTDTLKPHLYSNTPKIQCDRRNKDRDPVGRVASEILERATTYFIQPETFDPVAEEAVQSFLLPGQGQVWVRYNPHIEHQRVDLQQDEAGEFQAADGSAINPSEIEILQDANGHYYEEESVVFEEVVIDPVSYDDFICGHARRWQDTPYVGRRTRLRKEAVSERFGAEIAEKLNYTDAPAGDDNDDTEKEKSNFAQAEIWEIWDYESRCMYFVSTDHEELLQPKGWKSPKLKDPLGLAKFFPCPKPLFATLSGRSLVPTPFFNYYKKRARYLDELVTRKELLTQALKLKGVYDAAHDTLEMLLDEELENEMLPIENWAQFMGDGGIDKLVAFFPIEQIAKTLQITIQLIETEKQEIRDITGVSDIIRGASDPRETATAQNKKVQHASMRLRDKQAEVQRFIRDTFEIVAEIIAEHFSAATLWQITGWDGASEEDKQLFEPAVALLKNDALRSFRVDIETDSTIQADQEAERRGAMEFATAFGQIAEKSMKFSEAFPAYSEVMPQMLLHICRRFRAGRVLEGSIEAAAEKHKQMAQQKAQQPPQQDPKAMEGQMKLQLEQMKAQNQIQIKQMELKLKEIEMQQKLALDKEKFGQELSLKEQEMIMEHRRKQEEMAANAQLKIAELEGEMALERTKQQIDVENSLVQPRI